MFMFIFASAEDIFPFSDSKSHRSAAARLDDDDDDDLWKTVRTSPQHVHAR